MLNFLKKHINLFEAKSINDCTFVVLDTELTGLNIKKDELLSIGAIKMKGSQILLGEIFYREVYTPHFSTETVTIHKILPSEIQNFPEVAKIFPEFLDFIKDTVLVGYHIKIDLTFIEKYSKQLNLKFPKLMKVDVYRVYQWLKKKV